MLLWLILGKKLSMPYGKTINNIKPIIMIFMYLLLWSYVFVRIYVPLYLYGPMYIYVAEISYLCYYYTLPVFI
jgi:hypothetical protein